MPKQRPDCWQRPQLRPDKVLRWLAITGLALALTGCTHAGFGSSERHFATFSVPEPKGATVHVCHAYGCKLRTKFTFTAADIAELGAVMKTWRTKATPVIGSAVGGAADERRGVAYAIGWMERRVGEVIGTKDDRAGMEFAGSGDPTQQDCVDESTNTTSYLTVLANHGLLRHHAVGVPFAKENYLRGIAGWTHWTAVLIETASKQRWAVDSWIYANGENPAIVEAEQWYITDLGSLPPATH
jgi:hypothetical protein